MIVLIHGASHTGKTALTRRLPERYHYPCLSIHYEINIELQEEILCLENCGT